MVVIAHNIRSLHNVGAILRSADAFDVDRVYLTGFTGTPPRPEIAKVSLGSEDRISWTYIEDAKDAIAKLRDDGYRIVALDNRPGARPIGSISEPVALLLGNEVSGVDADLISACDETVEIPMSGRKKSLNVSVAAGIALFAISRSAP